jgi:CTP synthase
VKIGLVGKYNELPDAYKSIYEAFIHAGAMNECKVKVVPIHAEELENTKLNMQSILGQLDGILVAPGFGERGIEGKYAAIKYCRENKMPFFGICLGMQSAVVEFSRNVLNINDAASTEVAPNTANPVIDLMAEQKQITAKGGTMRLGAYTCDIKKKSKAYEAYKTTSIQERHRHRWEFNNQYLKQIEEAGMMATGINPESGLVEIVEIPTHPWFVAVQYHPELKSTVENPHPLFVHFVKACTKRK